MVRLRRLVLTLAGILLPAWIAPGQQGFYLGDHDRVLYYGDAKPDDRLYAGFIETYVLTRFPGWSISFAHSGSEGDLKADVFSRQPTVIVMTQVADRKTHQSIRSALPGTRITEVQTGSSPGKGRDAARVEAAGRVAGADDDTLTVDLIAPVMNVVRKANDAGFTAKVLHNGAPAGQAGHLLMALALLHAWHAPATVTAVEIDAVGKNVRRSENTTVRDLESERVVAWTEDDEALPMPFDFTEPTIYLAALCSNFMGTLNRQSLSVTGLSAWRYKLSIDGEQIGLFTRAQMAEGLNLAAMPTPMWKQAMAVGELSGKRREVQMARWELFQRPVEGRKSAEWKSALEALDAAEEDLVNRQREKLQARTHDYELLPVEQ